MRRRHQIGCWLAVRLSIAFAVVLAACSATTVSASWSGDGIHVVDGYWMLAEHRCDMAWTDACAQVVSAAETVLGLDTARVVGRATAALPTWKTVRSDGSVSIYLSNRSGVATFAILDLADGSRRVIGIECIGVPGLDGSWNCGAAPFGDYRVGATPSF